MQHAVTLLGPAHQHLGAGLTGLEVVMGQITLSLVAKHYPKQRVRCGKTRYCLLLEKSDHEGETHAKEKPATSRFFLASLLSYPGAHFAFFKNPVKIYETLIRIRISLKK